MIVFVPILETKIDEEHVIPNLDGVSMSYEKFLDFENKEPGFKYEWNNGILEAEEKLKPREAILYRNLHKKFIENTKLVSEFELISELECHLVSQKKIRIPDIGVFSVREINEHKAGNSFIPVLAIEIISPSNQVEELELKIKEYFQEGVKIVWCIFPKLREVRIYYSTKQIKICNEDDTCDFGNVIENFSITVNEIFQGY